MIRHNFDFAKNFLHLSILAGDFQRVDLLFGSNTGDGISQLGGNLLTDPEKYYKVFIIMMNTEEILRNTARSCKRTLPQRDLGSCSADLNGGKKTSTWLSGSGNFWDTLILFSCQPPGISTQGRMFYQKQWIARWCP